MTAVTMAYAALFIASAVTDVMELRIPNALVVALVLLFVLACVVAPPKSIFWTHVAPAAVVAALAAIPFFFDKFGGGDVKLMGAIGAWVGPLGLLVGTIRRWISPGLLLAVFLLGDVTLCCHVDLLWRGQWPASPR